MLKNTKKILSLVFVAAFVLAGLGVVFTPENVAADIVRPKPGGSQECDTYNDEDRVESTDRNNCISRSYCEDASIPEDERRETGCPESTINNGEQTYDRETFDGDCKAEALTAENCGIIKYIVLVINTLSALVGVVVVIMVAVGGVKYSTARDNPQATQLAKQKISNALLALIAYFMLYGVLNYLIPGGLF